MVGSKLDAIHEGYDGGSDRCLCHYGSDTYLDFFRDGVRGDDVRVRDRCDTALLGCLAFRVRVLERTGVLARRLEGASSSLLTTM